VAGLPIYMDNHATTPVDPRVMRVMEPYFTEQFGNASSRTHAYGWTAEAAVDLARERVAALIGGSPGEVVFTSGATEADNLAIKGAARAYRRRGDRIVTVATEHKAVLDSCKRLEDEGFRVTYLVPDAGGLVAPEAVADAVDDATTLVSVMLVNNEIGVIQPVGEIAAAVKAKNPKTLVHCDAVQGASTLSIDVESMQLDLVSLSAHKMYGPKGVGALWVRRRPRVKLIPLIDGGGHERGLRSGTLPVPLIVGFGVACELATAERDAERTRLAELRDRLYRGIADRLDGVHLNGAAEPRVAGNLNLSFERVDGEPLLMALREVAVSSGAACSSASREPSYVLAAIGVPVELAASSIRFGLGRFNSADEVDQVIEMVVRAVSELRAATATTPPVQEDAHGV
jgi:cysteine desulfurase